jgi:D-tyrosyl-tRNA(Tyr) deacylase
MVNSLVMRAVVQRVKHAAVTINGHERRAIGPGIVVLLGVGQQDSPADAEQLAAKIESLRIFEDESGKMNYNLNDVRGECLIVSQFTLYGDCRRGKRPSFTDAAPPPIAVPLYEMFIQLMREFHQIPVTTGEFGADMLVEIANDGPVTFLLDTKKLF